MVLCLAISMMRGCADKVMAVMVKRMMILMLKKSVQHEEKVEQKMMMVSVMLPFSLPVFGRKSSLLLFIIGPYY